MHRDERISLVLQGGGALGSYQAGVYQALEEAGVATIEDVDKAVVAGLSHPMGPLRLSDLIGLDNIKKRLELAYKDQFKLDIKDEQEIGRAHV